jgi:hypothetical protein
MPDVVVKMLAKILLDPFLRRKENIYQFQKNKHDF